MIFYLKKTVIEIRVYRHTNIKVEWLVLSLIFLPSGSKYQTHKCHLFDVIVCVAAGWPATLLPKLHIKQFLGLELIFVRQPLGFKATDTWGPTQTIHFSVFAAFVWSIPFMSHAWVGILPLDTDQMPKQLQVHVGLIHWNACHLLQFSSIFFFLLAVDALIDWCKKGQWEQNICLTCFFKGNHDPGQPDPTRPDPDPRHASIELHLEARVSLAQHMQCVLHSLRDLTRNLLWANKQAQHLNGPGHA